MATVSSRHAAKPKGTTNQAAGATAPTREPGRGRNYFTSAKAYYLALLLIAAASLWMRKGFPVYLLPSASFDDGLFLGMARSLKAGNWLGPYDELTLAKGMIYPVFICLASFAAIPLKIAEQAVYLAASALTAGLVCRRVGSNRLTLALFALLAFNPILWNAQLARVIREGLYVGLSLAVVSLAVVISFPVQEGGRYGRRIFQGFCLGFVGGAFWLTREEGIWLLPSLAVVLAVVLIGVLRPDETLRSGPEILRSRSDHLKAIALPFAVALAVFLATNGLVAGLNYRHYGIFETNEFRAKSFLRAYGALMRIQHDEWRRYVPFPEDARRRAYSVSPAARELRPFLEGPLAEVWRNNSCQGVNVPCTDALGGWFVWELRDAVAHAGHYGAGAEAMRFYDALADEINAACDHGGIPCLPARASMSPPFRREYLGETLGSAKNVAKALFTMGDGVVGSNPSLGQTREIKAYADLVRGVYPPSILVVQGWAAGVSGTPRVALVRRDEAPAVSMSPLRSQDFLSASAGLRPTPFEFETDCPVEACDLAVTEPAGRFRVSLTQLAPGTSFKSPGALLAIETFTVPGPGEYSSGGRLKIAASVASGYAIGFPILAVFGAAGLLSAVVFRKQCKIPASLLALGLGSLAAVVTRIFLLAYIDATSFPAANQLYTSPATPFVIIFAVVGIYAGYIILRAKLRLLPTWGARSSGDKSAEEASLR